MCRIRISKEELEAIRKSYKYKDEGKEVPEEIKKIVDAVKKRHDEQCEC